MPSASAKPNASSTKGAPVDESAVKAIVDANIERLMRAFGVPHWKIRVVYGPCEQDHWQAECLRQVNYNFAEITINPHKHSDEAEVIESLEHELMHVVHSPFDLFYEVALQFVNDKDALDALSRTWSYCTEQTVVNLNRLKRGLANDA
jgi:hypothetical protein